MYKKIKGIIINEYPFEDNSKIINIFTEDKLIGVLAKGAKKIKSPFFSSIFLVLFNAIFLLR